MPYWKNDTDLLRETYFADVDPQFLPDEPNPDDIEDKIREKLDSAFRAADDCRTDLSSALDWAQRPCINFNVEQKIVEMIAAAGKLMQAIEEML